MNSTPRPPRGAKAASPANDNKTARACAICGRRSVEKYAPFCSRRCADVDLYRWLNGKYAIPASEETEPEDGAAEEEE